MFKRLAYLGLGLLILLILPLSFTRSLRNLALRAVKPLATILIRQNVGLSNFTHNITQLSSLRDEKTALQKEVIDLQNQVAEQESIKRENESLRQELGVTGIVRTTKKVFAHVTIAGNDPFDRTFSIDVGSNEGLVIGQPAVSQGVLVGKVVEVRSNSAVIRSVISKESRIQVWIVENREKGLLIGDGHAAHLTNITQGLEIKETSLLETSGLGGSLPQGIQVGQTGVVESKKSEAVQQFAVTIPVDPTSLESVFILLTNG